MEKTVKEVPPAPLTMLCVPATERTFTVTKDIIESRQDWISAFCECQSRMGRLVQWNTGVAPPAMPACPDTRY